MQLHMHMSDAAGGWHKCNCVWTEEVKRGVREKIGFSWQVKMKMNDPSKQKQHGQNKHNTFKKLWPLFTVKRGYLLLTAKQQKKLSCEKVSSWLWFQINLYTVSFCLCYKPTTQKSTSIKAKREYCLQKQSNHHVAFTQVGISKSLLLPPKLCYFIPSLLFWKMTFKYNQP